MGISERYATRKASGAGAEYHYVITGFTDEKSARDQLLSTAPMNVTVTEPFGTLQLIREDENCSVDEVADGIYYGTATFKSPPDAIRPSGSFQVSFDISGIQTKITQSLSTVNSYVSPSAVAAGLTKPNFGGAINVQADGSIEGTDINVPQLTYTVSNTYTNSQMSASFIQTIVGCVGAPNISLYRGFAIGCLLLTSAAGVQRSDTNWDVTFKFAVAQAYNNVTIGDITGITADGWDYVWVYHEDRPDLTTTFRCNKQPVAVYVERILKRAEYANLNIGAGS